MRKTHFSVKYQYSSLYESPINDVAETRCERSVRHGQTVDILTIAYLISIKRYGVYMIPHTKIRYFDEIHKICDSQSNFYVFSLDFFPVLLKGKAKVVHTAPFDLFFPPVNFGRNQFLDFSKICRIHEKKNSKRCGRL